MKKPAAILCAMALLASSGRAAPAPPATPATRQSIDRLLALSGVEQNRQELVTQLNRFFAVNLQQALRGQSLAPAQQEALRELRRSVPATIESELSWPALRGLYEKVYAETFSQDEVDGLIAFYSSPAGQAFLHKQSLLVLNSIQLAERRIGQTAVKPASSGGAEKPLPPAKVASLDPPVDLPAIPAPSATDSTLIASRSIDTLGLALLRARDFSAGNALLSPYSIQTVLAMAYAGAEGITRTQMAAALGYPSDEATLDGSFKALRSALAESESRDVGLDVADRLFGQSGFGFRPAYVNLLKDRYQADLESLDFAGDPAGAAQRINAWVARQTHDHIQNLVPVPASRDERLVLANAIYFKAPWSYPFNPASTRLEPFHLANGTSVDVPTMAATHLIGYVHGNGYTVLALPYAGGLQFTLFIPDSTDGLPAMESELTADIIENAAHLPAADVALSLPKFHLEPPLAELSKDLQALGMKSAFNLPDGSVDFDGIAPPKPPAGPLFISGVFHKTYIDVDEAGTEAAAATAVVMVTGTRVVRRVEVHADHPFLFAIQHCGSGACLFIGRVDDPR